MSDVRTRVITREDIPRLIPLLADAFLEQPLTRWVLGTGPRALKRGERVLRLDFDHALPYGLMYTTLDLKGAALWQPPDRTQTLRQGLAWLGKLLLIAGIGRHIVPQIAMYIRFEKIFPRAPHYYLSLLAVAPGAQGKGIGGALLRPVLDRCDREGIPAYTATDTPLNVRFYQQQGFGIRDEIPVPRGGFTMWTLWREPGDRMEGQFHTQ
ncbi:MAG: GNAT family N-acetyltransferase [Candidatus Aureabacteria bacterium]|nr:GNAT family N-acetyltransferase [Candidatus Auribacterota bacterium]